MDEGIDEEIEMINRQQFINIGIRSVPTNEAMLQKGFDEGYTNGIELGMQLGAFIAEQSINKRNGIAKDDDVKEKVKVLKKLLSGEDIYDRRDEIKKVLEVNNSNTPTR